MAEIDQTPPILGLPLELRELIYREVLSDSSQGSQLLRASAEIYSEAHKFLFQRSILFRGQKVLYHWLDEIPQTHLHHVVEIRLEIQDVDFKPLLAPITRTVPASSTHRLLTWELYEQEMDRLDEALRKLPNVRTLTVRAPPEIRSFLYQEFLTKITDSLGWIYPSLANLALEGNFHHQSLNFLSSFKELKSVSFDGFSSSSSTETATVFSNLTRLTNLSLVSQRTLLKPETYLHSSFTSNSQSLTFPVLLSMRKLTSISLTETMHLATISPLFFTPEVLTALCGLSTLNSLSISLAHAPTTETLEAFEDFLDHAKGIQKLELDWHGLEPEVLEEYSLLPERVRDFWIRCEGMGEAFDILYTITENRRTGHMKELKRVVLMRRDWESDEVVTVIVDEEGDEDRNADDEAGENTAEAWDEGRGGSGEDENDAALFHDLDTDNTDEMDFACAKRGLTELGVQVLWCTQSA